MISDIIIIVGTVALTLLLSKWWDRVAATVVHEAQRAMFEDVDYLLKR